MSAPVTSQSSSAQGRNPTGWVVGFCLVVFAAATFYALYQPPRPDPFKPATIMEKFIYPVEQNGFMRLPVVTGNFNDVFVTPGSGHVWAVGDGGLILVSEDQGQSWQQRAYPAGVQGPVPPALEKKEAGLKWIRWGPQTAYAKDPISEAPKTKQEKQEVPRQTTVTPIPQQKQQQVAPQQPEHPKQTTVNQIPQQLQEVIPQPPKPEPERIPDLRAIFFVNADKGWIAGSGGTILRTSDGGRSWAPQSSRTQASLYALHFVDGKRGWASGFFGTILRTSDGGRSWVPQSSGTDASLSALHFVDGERGWACGAGGTILRTSDGGRSWAPQPSGTYARLYGLYFVDDERGWACGYKGTTLRTSDGGRSWESQSSGTDASLSDLYFFDGERGWACGSDGTILQTSDAGRSWAVQSSGSQASLSALYFLDGDIGWAGGIDGTLLRTADGGQSWQVQNSFSNGALSALHFADREHGWASGMHGTILSTTDGGRSWQALSSGRQDWLWNIYFLDREHGWACGDYGTILSTIDGGQNWQVRTSGTLDWLWGIYFTDLKYGWVCGEAGTILSTTDGGQSWQIQNSHKDFTLFAIHFTDHLHGWACGESGTFLSTIDGGRSWKALSSGTQADLSGIHFTDRKHGWVCGDHGTVLSTTDGGRSWQMQVSGMQDDLDGIYFTDSKYGWVTGGYETVFSTTDGGQKWQVQSFDALVEVEDLFFTDRQNGWACGEGNTILKTTDGGQTWRLPTYRRIPALWYWTLCLCLILVSLFVVQQRNQPEAAGETVADLLASDKPLEAGEPDPLGLNRISAGIARFIANRNTDPPLTIAVTGEWGTGKSSLMNLLFHDLKMRRFQPVWFNAWHHQKGEQLLASLYAHIRRQAVPPVWHPGGLLFRLRLLYRRGRRNWVIFWTIVFLLVFSSPYLKDVAIFLEEELKNIFENANNIEGLIRALFASPVVAFALKSMRAFGLAPQRLLAFRMADGGKKSGLDPGARARFAQEFQDVADSLDLGAMVIFIDDLDRCTKENVVEILETINFLAVSGRCFIVLGMAKQWVETCVALQFKELAEETEDGNDGQDDGFAHRRRFARQYLEKLINIEVPVPVPSPDAARALLAPELPETDAPLTRMMAAVGRVTKKYAPIFYLAVLAALAWGLWHLPVGSDESSPKRKDLLVAPADSRSGELVLRYTKDKAEQKPVTGTEEKQKSKSSAPDKEPTGKAGFRPGAEDDSHTGLWLALLAGLGLATIGVRYLLLRPQRFTEDSRTFREALNIWHPWIVLMNRTPRTIKRFLNRLRYVAMRLRSETENLSLWERIRRKISGKEEAKAEEESPASVPEPVLVALGAIHHVKPEWVGDPETLQALFAGDSDALADRIRQAFPDADTDSENLAETAAFLNQAIVNYRNTFGQGVKPLISHREAFLEVLAETGM